MKVSSKEVKTYSEYVDLLKFVVYLDIYLMFIIFSDIYKLWKKVFCLSLFFLYKQDMQKQTYNT